MSKYQKLLTEILSGVHDQNIAFSDLQKLLTLLGFMVRINGDHFIYTKDDVEEIIKAIPHEACAQDAPSDFLSDCIEISQAG